MAKRNRHGAGKRVIVGRASGQAQRKQHRITSLLDLPVTLHSLPARFEPHLDELLKKAGVKVGVNARSDLVKALQLAQACAELRSQDRAPSELVEQLEGSIKKTLALLRRITTYRYSRDLGFVMHPVGSGVVDVATVQEGIRGQTLELPRHPSISDAELRLPSAAPDGMWAAINIEPLLRAIMIKIKAAKRKRSQPKKLWKEGIVFYAAQFFCRHSPHRPSNYAENPFPAFAERFYETVTGTEPRNLDWQIRQVLKDRRVRAGD